MLSVTRQDAIGFQLDTAIRLWFEDSDRISAHTLACSALKIAHDVATKYGKAGMLWAVLPGKFHKAATEAQNFFKHADKDPSKVLQFNSELTKFHIFDAISLYRDLYRGTSLPMDAFLLWCTLNEPEIGIDKLTINLPVSTDKDALVEIKRDIFFGQAIEILRSAKAASAGK